MSATVGNLAPESVIGKSDVDFFDNAENFTTADNALIEEFERNPLATPKKYTESYHPKNGKQIAISTVKSCYFNEKGMVAGVVGYFVDRSTEVGIERALRSELEAIFENCPEGIYTHSLNRADGFKFLDANSKVDMISGYNREEFRQLSVMELVHPEDRDFARQKIQNKIDAGPDSQDETTYDIRIIRKDEVVANISITTRIIWDGMVPMKVIGVARDVGRQRAENEQFVSDLIAASSDGALSSIVHTLCHDLKTPMSNACLCALSIARTQFVPPDVKAQALIIRGLCDEAWKGIEEYFSRLNNPTPKVSVLDLRPIVSDIHLHARKNVLDMYVSRTAPSNINLRIIPAPDRIPAVTVKADRALIWSVLLNAIRNSAEAIVQKNGPKRDIFIHLEFSQDFENAIIRICDTGGGMDAEMIRQLNLPHSRVRSSKKARIGVGTGLIRAILRSHNAQWEFSNIMGEYSEPVGLELKIWFPIATDA